MALIYKVEDGTGHSDATAYFSVEDVSAYQSFFGNTDWGYRPDLHERAIVRASRTFDSLFGTALRGNTLTTTQSLLFPRTSFKSASGLQVDAGEMPNALLAWIAEAALLDIQDKLFVTETSGNVKVTKLKAGDFEESTTYFNPINTSNLAKANSYVTPLLAVGSGSTTIGRG